jgi:hypothetical protein
MYRIPSIHEFKEGFEYEYATEHSFVIWDPSDGVQKSFPWTTVWHKAVVPSLDKTTYPHTFKVEDTIVTVMNDPDPTYDMLEPIKVGLQNGQIRAKMLPELPFSLKYSKSYTLTRCYVIFYNILNKYFNKQHER